MNKTIKLSAISIALLQAFYVSGTMAAEEQNEEKKQDVEVIQVKGFAGSLGKALREKRYSESLVEVVSADDLGVLPDVSITDSLVRLPGIAASRDRGNASRISIRGMGPRLNAATMNDREIVSAEPSRDVRFEQFPAELIDSVQVYKSPIASKVEGGISGLVNMNFVSPLSKDKSRFAISGHWMKNELGDDLPGTDGTGSKASVSYVGKVNEDFGYALGFTYQDQPSLERGVQSWDYNNGDNRGDLDESGTGEDAPWGVMAKSKRGQNERFGSLLILEGNVSDNLNIKGDLFYSSFEITELDDQMGPGDLGNWADGGSGPRGWAAGAYDGSSISPVIVTKPDGSEQLVTGSQFNNGLTNYNPTWFQENEMLSTGIKATYAGDEWTFIADVGMSKASINSVWVYIDPLYVGGDYDLGFNTQGTDAAEIIVHQGDISSPENYSLGAVSEAWYEADDGSWYSVDEFVGATMNGAGQKELTDEMTNVNLDVLRDVEFGPVESISFGARQTSRTKENRQVQDWSKTAIESHGLTDYGMSYTIGGDYNVPDIYTFKDWDLVADQAFGGVRSLDDSENVVDPLASWELEEVNTAFYFMATLNGEIGDIDYSGNVGLRYAHTDVTSRGHEFIDTWLEDENGNWYQPAPSEVSVNHDYAEILPSLNLTFFVTDSSQIRFGLARTLARPPLLEMRTGFGLDKSALPPTANGGNPTLNPYVANQLDVGYEYFWGDNSAATINVFFKDLESHIGLDSGTVNFNGDEYAFTGPVNGDGGLIKGFELLLQHQFKTLPAPFDGLGVFANYSYTDSDVMEFKPQNNPYNLGGLSKNIGSLTMWYEKHGFDARVSYNYRSDFTGINSWIPSNVNLNEAESTVDLSMGYQVNDSLKFTFQIQNLTDAASINYWDNDKTKLAYNVEWGRRFLLGFQYSL